MLRWCVLLLFFGIPISYSNTENQRPILQRVREASAQISRGSQLFSFEMVHTIANALHGYDVNFITAPFSVWALMTLCAEGATDQTFAQMENTLHLPKELVFLRYAYKAFKRVLVVNTSTVELAVNQAMFSDLNRPIREKYATILRNDYEADHVPVDFRDKFGATNVINDFIKFKTRGKIQNVIKPNDLYDATLLLTTTIFFKGQWTYPFDVSETTEMEFYRENGESAGKVPMMYRRHQFRFADISSLGSTVVQLPYGKENRLFMLLLLPRRNTTLIDIFHKLKDQNLATIMNQLQNEEEDIDLYLPRFSIDSDFELNTVLETMGITDIFNPTKSNLLKLSEDPIYVSRVFHKAIIEVNEKGTVAAGAVGASFTFQALPRSIMFNRPFGFLITDRQTNTMLFAGQVKYPKTS